jgi:putative transposase
MVLNEYGRIAEEPWKAIPNHFERVSLDYFVIMLNHIHGIIIIEGRDTACCVPTMEDRKFGEMNHGSLSVIVRSFKSAVTKRINELRKGKSTPVWQKNYYEHIICNEMDLFYIRIYIENNPLKWELDEYYMT